MQWTNVGLAIVALIMGVAPATSLLAQEAQNGQTVAALTQAEHALALREKTIGKACSRNYRSPNKTRQQSIHCSGNVRAKRNKVHNQRLEVQALLSQLEAGRPVDASAVDRLLREAGVAND